MTNLKYYETVKGGGSKPCHISMPAIIGARPRPPIRFRLIYMATVAKCRATDYEFGGQEFESLRARHQINGLDEALKLRIKRG